MKKIRIVTLVVILAIAGHTTGHAQGWNQDRNGIYSVGVGGTQVIAFGWPYPVIYGAGFSINFSGEYKAARFVGVGFQTGLDVLLGPPYGPERPRYTALAIPIAIKVNVHILEAANVPIRDKLDVYAGLNLGGGPAFFASTPSGVFGFMQVGPQFGVRYWLNPNIALFGELGWGATFANIGFTF